MRTLRDIQPTGILTQPDQGFPYLIENFFIRLFYEPRIKELIGWIGIGYRESSSRGWTFRFKGQRGVYGLQYGGSHRESSTWSHGIFYIQYFPAAGEDILEYFSIRENILRQDPSFERLLRAGPSEDDPLESQFIVGRLVLSVDTEEDNLFLSLSAPERWREIVRDGLSLPKEDGTLVEAVPPGGVDRNVPAYSLAWPFFDKIILTVAYFLKDHPIFVALKGRPAQIFEITDKKRYELRPSHNIEERCLTVGFGPEPGNQEDDPRFTWMIGFFPAEDPSSSSPASRMIWFMKSKNPDPSKVNPLWWEAPGWEETLKLKGVKALGLDYRPPLLVITGFLGSGKTTLLNKVVEHYTMMHNKFVAVIQNEVGQINVDGKATDGAIAVTELEDGCVCCTLLGEFRRSIRKLCIEYEPDLIIVETTGIADPNNILSELPQLEPFVRFDSLVTVVDGSNLEMNLKEHPVARAQIEASDLILLNKFDLMGDEARAWARSMLERINPRATIVSTVNAQIPPGILLCSEDDIDQLSQGQHSDEVKEALSGAYSGQQRNFDLDSQNIETVSIVLEGRFEETELIQLLDNLPDSIYRLKGFVNIVGLEKTVLLQYVTGRYEFENLPTPAPGPNRLVFIGRYLDEEGLKASFGKCLEQES